MDDLTFNRQILIDNLRTDVLILDKVLRHLLSSFHSTLPPGTLRSWKYPGNSVLDVDIDTLVKCFGHPKSSQSDVEQARSHVILLELAVDRLSAIMAVAVCCLQQCCSSLSLKKEKKTVVRTSSLPALSATYVATFMNVLEVWGVGSRQKETAAVESQTESAYDPHEGCENCKELLRVTDVIRDSLTAIFGRQLDDSLIEPVSADSFRKLDHYVKVLIENHQESLERVKHQQEKLRHCSSALNGELTKNEELERQLRCLKESIVQKNSEVQEIQIELSERRRILDSLQNEEMGETKRTTDLQKELHCVTLECQEHQKKAKDLQDEIAAHENQRSSENLRWVTLIRDRERELQNITQNIDDLEKCYDPLWKDKFRQTQQDLHEINSLVKDAQAMYDRNKQRIKQLEEELFSGRTESVA